MAIRIVADSTADLSQEIRSQYGIEMVPLTVHFGPESFKDVVEMNCEGFWEKLKTSPHHPKTAQPSPGDFLEAYQPIVAAGDEIVSIHISGALSGTVSSAQVAKQMLPDDAKVTVIDTKLASLGIGLLAVDAARMAQEGKSAAEIQAYVQEKAVQTHIYFTLDTLEFLQKNGRVGKAQALIGGLLGIKPILHVDREGLVAPADKVRGKSKVLARMIELMKEQVPAGRSVKVGVLHTQVPHEAEAVLEEIKKHYNVVESMISPIGPVIATNVGPGALGVAFYEV